MSDTSRVQRQTELTLTDRELLDRLGWFTHVRWLVGVFCLVLLFTGHYLLGVRFYISDRSLALFWSVEVVVGVFAYNTVFTLLVRALRAKGRVTRRRIQQLAVGQIACDLVGVCALVHATGGIENYFIVLTVLPLVIAAELLPPALAYASAGGAVALIQALLWGEQQGLIPHISVYWPGAASVARAHVYADPMYVLEVTSALTILLLGTVFLAATIAGRLRGREEDLERAYRQIQLTDDAKSFFMRKAGHELRSPLVAVGSILKAIVQTVKSLPDEHRRLVDRAQQRTQAAMAILDDLRRYAKLHSVQNLLSTERVELGQTVRAVTELLRPQAEAAGLRLICAAEDASIQGDQELLREVVSNLLVNAIQYTPAGGRIELAVHNGGPVVRLEVSDTGIGISEKARQHLFEEFFRAEEAKQVFAEGTGLGLAICQRIVHMHGGQITAANRPEGGSIFTVELPAGSTAVALPADHPAAMAGSSS